MTWTKYGSRMGYSIRRRKVTTGNAILWEMFCCETSSLLHIDVTFTFITVTDHAHLSWKQYFLMTAGSFCTIMHCVTKQNRACCWPGLPRSTSPDQFNPALVGFAGQTSMIYGATFQDLKDLLLPSWCQITQQIFRSLDDSISQQVRTLSREE